MKSLSRENQADMIEAFNSTSRYYDDLLNIDNIYFDQMVDRIYPTELQLNRANSSDTEALQQGISEPEVYGDLVYRFRKIVGKSNFSEQFRKLINPYKRIRYSLDIMRQTACLVVNPIIVDGYASLFNCTTAVRASDSMTASS